MKGIDRIHQYLEYKGIKPTRFEKETGLSNGYLGTQFKRSADLGESVLNKIIDYCLDINPEWLLTGQGEMLRNERVSKSVPINNIEDKLFAIIKEKDAKIEELSKEIGRLEQVIEGFDRKGDTAGTARIASAG